MQIRLIKHCTTLLAVTLIAFFSYNIYSYNPLNGYDAEAHHTYIDFIAMYLPADLNLPDDTVTREFFNPPVPYLFPAIIAVVCRNIIEAENLVTACQPIYGNLTQIFQALLFFASLLFYKKFFKNIYKNEKVINYIFLLMVGLLTVNFKTFVMIRGEVYIIFFHSIMLYVFSRILIKNYKFNKYEVLWFGTLIGLMALSRQWSFLMFLGYGMYIFFITSLAEKKRYFNFLTYSFLIGFIISGWFYIGLFIEYGSFTAFNMETKPFKFSNQPLSFYFPISQESYMVFTKPIRPYFRNEFLPILFSDLWGDYWGYFSFTSRNLEQGRNQLIIGDYLARVNIVSLLPTAILIIGFVYSIKKIIVKNKDLKDRSMVLLSLLSIFTILGYLWFLITHPTGSGDTNKATYVIQLFHCLSLISTMYLYEIFQKNKKIFYILYFSLIAVFIHNSSAMLSHF